MFFACGMHAATAVVFSIPRGVFYIGSGLDIRKVTLLTVLQPIHSAFASAVVFSMKRLTAFVFFVNARIISYHVVLLLLQITVVTSKKKWQNFSCVFVS